MSDKDEPKDNVILHETPGCRVVLLPDSTVTKTGRHVTLDEVPALKLAAQLQLPVPHVHDAQRASPEGEAFIRMDFVPGERLDTVWPKLASHEKDSICQQLRQIFTTMRSASRENRPIGSCSGGEARDCRQYTDYSGGPFQDEAAFNSFYFDLVGTVPAPIRAALSQQLRTDHHIVFSHGDIAQHNILISQGRITGLIDWEYAGWYPEHWDYIKFFERPCKYRDWKDRAADIFPQCYDKELAAHQAIIRWQRP